jgi:vancomycin resistance protein YoaR
MRLPLARLVVAVLTTVAGAPAQSPSALPSGASFVDSDSSNVDSLRDDEASFPVVLGSFSTTLLGSTPPRTHNIRLAATALDGVVLEPGAELSFNERVGPRTAERGFLVAPVILREERQLQLGGGICQVASTLFDAALIAGLTPVERCRHSSPVDYVALGEDATIAWGYKDLKIRNDSEQTVRLSVELVGSTLLARIDGETPDERSYELTTEERDVPASTDSNLPGHEVELYRIHLIDGREVEREFVHRDLYPSARASR